jgi:hypothetical protein
MPPEGLGLRLCLGRAFLFVDAASALRPLLDAGRSLLDAARVFPTARDGRRVPDEA